MIGIVAADAEYSMAVATLRAAKNSYITRLEPWRRIVVAAPYLISIAYLYQIVMEARCPYNTVTALACSSASFVR
jgi:hypothetical protein